MIPATLQEAKAKLNQLIQAAWEGKDVVLLRGSRIVARIQPLSQEDLEISPTLTDSQAEHFWSEVQKEPKKRFRSTSAAVHFLRSRSV